MCSVVLAGVAFLQNPKSKTATQPGRGPREEGEQGDGMRYQKDREVARGRLVMEGRWNVYGPIVDGRWHPSRARSNQCGTPSSRLEILRTV
jgi:hypothetical protein